MKKLFCLLLAVLICLGFAACGAEPDPDHEYILSLLEKGEYDMAIEIIEHIKERKGAASAQKGEADSKVAGEDEAPAAAAAVPAEVPAGQSADIEVQITDLVDRFMDADGKEFQKEYKKISGNKAGSICLLKAAEYFLEDADGQGTPAHFILLSIGGNFAYGGYSFDAIQLAYDIDRGTFMSSANIDWNSIGSGEITTVEQLQNVLVNAYYSYTAYSGDILWTEMEEINELSAESIERINQQLK